MEKLKEKLKYGKKGITLIALVITIIVLLILAGVSIATLTGDNGILTKANDAKIETAIAAVKEKIQLEQVEKSIDGEKISPETLLAKGRVKRTVQQSEDGNYYMYYALKEDAYEEMQGLGKGNIANLKDIFLIDDDLNVKYISSNGKEYGDNINNKILEDETEIRFASKAFSEYISEISGITEEEMKFKWMKNQTILTIGGSDIDNLEDLIFFPNLTSLTLGDNSGAPPITTLNGVENCIKLTKISIIYGPNKDYSAIASLTNLTTFTRLGGSDFDNIIDVLKLSTSLESLELTGNGITSMKRIAELKDLKSLALNSNAITKIEGLENKPSLNSLYLANNKITKIEGLENLLNLKGLYLNINQITDITPLSINNSLIWLDLRENTGIDGNRNNYTGEKLEALNKIGKILDRNGTINVDVDKIGLFTNYKTLDLSNQKLTTLKSIEGLINLTDLNLTSNLLTLEDPKSQEVLKSMENLNSLNLNYNNVTNVSSINSLINLNTLYMTGKNNKINLQEIEDIISNLMTLTVSTESLKTIVNCDVNKITTLNLISSGLTEFPDLSNFTKLTKLNLNSNPDISNFDIISKITSLENLILSNNKLHGKMINFSKLTNLTNLDLSGNTLWSEDLENLKALKNNTNLTINLSNNSIIDATALLELNRNTKINLTNNVNLSPESKKSLTEHFGINVKYDK